MSASKEAPALPPGMCQKIGTEVGRDLGARAQDVELPELPAGVPERPGREELPFELRLCLGRLLAVDRAADREAAGTVRGVELAPVENQLGLVRSQRVNEEHDRRQPVQPFLDLAGVAENLERS